MRSERFALEKVITTGESTNFESSTPAADGKPIWLSNHVGPVHRDGKIVGAVIIAREVTEKKLTEAQLVASDRMASVGILAAGVAHEINNPRSAVTGNLDLACREVAESTNQMGFSPDLPDGLRDAREGAERIRDIVRLLPGRGGAAGPRGCQTRPGIDAAHGRERDPAPRAREALDRIAAGERFDVILCDLMMPDVTGMDVHEELTRIAPEQVERVILMTGGAFTARAREFLERVPNVRLDKPFEPRQLRALVNDRIR